MAALPSVRSAIRRLRIEKGFHSLPCARGGCHSPFGELEKVGETPIESFFSLPRTASSKQTSCLSLSHQKLGMASTCLRQVWLRPRVVFFCTCSVLKTPGQQEKVQRVSREGCARVSGYARSVALN